ncbi:MAG: alpha/beta hydrolase [Pseudomonadota bacterium]
MTEFIRIPSNPPPPGAETFQFNARDGAPLRGAYFPRDHSRRTILLLTGWSEFIEKYFEVVGDLHDRGFSVAMMDWRGQGLSDRNSPRMSSWVGYFDRIADDLRYFAHEYVSKRFGPPHFLMTHSMGGMAALTALAAGEDQFKKAVLCAPMSRLFPNPVNAFFHRAADLACLLGQAGSPIAARTDDAFVFEGNIFTKDRARHERFRDLQLAEPRAAISSPTYGWVRDAMRASKALHRAGGLDKLKTPTLIVTAGEEKRVDAADHQRLAARNVNISVATIQDALHEIMMETDEIRSKYWAVVDDFLGDYNTA